MPKDTQESAMSADELLSRLAEALPALDAAQAEATAAMRAAVAPGGRVEAAAMEREQSAAHGLAWLATYVESLKALHAWAAALEDAGRFGEIERLILQIGVRRNISPRSPAAFR